MRAIAAAGALALSLAGCGEQSGYVEIKVLPGYVVPPLVLGSARIDTARPSTVLRQGVGTARLEFERDGRRIPLCEFDVRKDRIVTVAISSIGRDPRCKVQG